MIYNSPVAPDLFGMLMMKDDHDVLEEVLDCNARHFKALFVLDGSDDYQRTQRILSRYPNVEFYLRDAQLDSHFVRPPRDGARQVLLEAIQSRYGTSGIIFILHSDEMFYDLPPGVLAAVLMEHNLDAVGVSNMHFFLHTSMEGHYYRDPARPIVEQIEHACFPGVPEVRAFRNQPGLAYQPNEHGKVEPHGLTRVAHTSFPLRHYLYRTEEQMRRNALDRSTRGWQGYGQWMTEQSCYVDKLPGDFMKFSQRIAPGERLANGRDGTLASGSSEPLIRVKMLHEKDSIVRRITRKIVRRFFPQFLDIIDT